MPFVEEKHLVDIHRHLEEKEISEERLARELRKQRLLNKKYRKTNVRLLWSLVSAAMVVLVIVVTYLLKPSIFVDQERLSSENKVLLDKGQLAELQGTLEGKSEEIENLKHILQTLDYRALDDEVVYTVQVAALVNENVDLVSEDLLNMNIYKDLPYNKFALGSFANLKDAQKLRKALVKLGFKDAFVASYRNGKRIKIEDPELNE
ncbi:SPOR domain-containing protein [Robertkochia flava]|uniref:SPOR domain-containing protein n=1 Tax=Robertkochia flava TaxID=3447986 RepID=UPI001CCF6891|nr:SPOR domain-containing protein [Robertkochia marina]